MTIEILLFSLVLSIDSFSAAVALGFRHFSRKRAFFFAFSSGLSEGLATTIGFFLGQLSRQFILQYDHWLAFSLLALVGGHMCYQSYWGEDSEDEEEMKVHSLWKILLVSSVTSIDSLGVGVSLGLMAKPIVSYATSIGLCAFLSTYVGLFLAKSLSQRWGSRAELFGGVVLVLLGVKMLSL